MLTIKAEDARTPHDPRMTAYEAGRWYALNGLACPCGATPECRRGYADAEMEIIDAMLTSSKPKTPARRMTRG